MYECVYLLDIVEYLFIVYDSQMLLEEEGE